MNKIFNRAGLLLLMGTMVVLLGVSYAGYTDILTVTAAYSSGNMDFQFAEEEDFFSVEIQSGDQGYLKDLKANAEYDGKTLKITDMDPVDISLLEKGDLRFIIRYGIKASGSSSVMKAASTDLKKDKNAEAEYVTFVRTSTTPQFILKGGMKELEYWDTGNIPGVASQTIYDFLPDDLGKFYVSKSLMVDEKEEIMQGIIILEQADTPRWVTTDSILLSSLDMPDDMLEFLAGKGDLELSLQGCYGFQIPLIFDQFNVERMR